MYVKYVYVYDNVTDCGAQWVTTVADQFGQIYGSRNIRDVI